MTTGNTNTNTNTEQSAVARMCEIRNQLAAGLMERDNEANGLAVAFVAQTHALLLGPPGSAKSLVARQFAAATMPADGCGGRYFQRLLSAFTTPEDVFGPLNLPKLEAGEYERCVDGYLPTANQAYLDEIFNANQSLLTTLNTVLEEREFDQGTQRVQVPLRMAVGASNRYPEGDMALEALYDRFLVRHWVAWVEDEDNLVDLLDPDYEAAPPTAELAQGDADLLIAARKRVGVPVELRRQIAAFKRALAADGIECSTRRWKASVKLIQAQALINGNAVAQPRDCMILADSLWDRHDQRPAIYSLLTQHFAPTLGKVQATLDAMIQAYSDLDLPCASGAELGRLRDQLDAAVGILGALDATGMDADVAEAKQTIEGMARNVVRAFDANMGLSGLG